MSFLFFPTKSTCFKHKPSVQTKRKNPFQAKSRKCTKTRDAALEMFTVRIAKRERFCDRIQCFVCACTLQSGGKKTLRAEAFHHHHCIMMKKENERDILLPFAGACFGARVRWIFHEIQYLSLQKRAFSASTQVKRQFPELLLLNEFIDGAEGFWKLTSHLPFDFSTSNKYGFEWFLRCTHLHDNGSCCCCCYCLIVPLMQKTRFQALNGWKPGKFV